MDQVGKPRHVSFRIAATCLVHRTVDTPRAACTPDGVLHPRRRHGLLRAHSRPWSDHPRTSGSPRFAASACRAGSWRLHAMQGPHVAVGQQALGMLSSKRTRRRLFA